MSKFICTVTDATDGKQYFFEWSTIVDAPTTYGMFMDEFREYYRFEYGNSAMAELDERLEMAMKTGCSARSGETFEDLLVANPDGLTREAFLEIYCRNRPGNVQES